MASPPRLRARYPGEFMFAIARDRLALFQRMARLGDVVQVNVAGQPIVLVSDPEAIRSVLVTNNRAFQKGRGVERMRVLLGNGLLTSEGEFHLRQRRLAQPAFHRARMAGYADVMVRHATAIAQTWHAGATLDIHAEMMRLTLGIAARTLFDADIETEARDVAEVIEMSLRLFRFATLPFGEHLERLPIPVVRRMKRMRTRMDLFIHDMIAERRTGTTDRGDLLSMLLVASEDGAGMTDQQIRDEIMTILMAGHETTAVALSWTWWLLSEHPEVAERVHAEIHGVVGGRDATNEDVPLLPLTRAVLSESMRLHPPAWVIGRRALMDMEIGGFAVPAEAIVLMSQYIVQRDARWFVEPKEFRPERWLDGSETSRPRFCYFPFGGGPRVCIGEQFAWTEGVLAIATIARHWRMHHDSTRPVGHDALVTLRPRNGMWMQMERR